MPHPHNREAEWQTRKQRIDPRLDALGWSLAMSGEFPLHGAHRREEFETAHGPADYTLFADGRPLGIVEAKKLTWRRRAPGG